jgi:hypothetical protein
MLLILLQKKGSLNKMKNIYFYLVMTLNLGVLTCFADGSESSNDRYSMSVRCKDDQISDVSEVMGRNAWARKCGYLSADLEEGFNDWGVYFVFTDGKKDGEPNIPVTEESPCILGLSGLGGCYVASFPVGKR